MAWATALLRDSLARSARIQVSSWSTKGSDVGLAPGAPRVGRMTIDPALEFEDHVDPVHGLDRERCLGGLGQLEELAPPVRPTRCLGDRRGLVIGRIVGH